MKIYHSLFAVLFVWVLFGCEKDIETGELSTITYYPTFEMVGDPLLHIGVGDTYTEPGITASEDGVTLEVSTSVTGRYFGYKGSEMSTSMADIYEVSYTATNSDGYNGSVSRTVIVSTNGDLVNSIEGIYTATVARNGTLEDDYKDMKYVIIAKTGANTYALSDGIGGYYDLGRAYGTGYAAAGVTITANDIPANDFSFNNPFGVGAFGGAANITSMTVDPGAGTIAFTTEWDAGYTFEVTLTQVTL